MAASSGRRRALCAGCALGAVHVLQEAAAPSSAFAAAAVAPKRLGGQVSPAARGAAPAAAQSAERAAGLAAGLGAAVSAGAIGGRRASRTRAVARRAEGQAVKEVETAAADLEEGKDGREVVVENQNTEVLVLEGATVAAMDAFMQENAAEVCLQNLAKIEPSPEDPEVRLCYLEPNDIGPYRSQMRLSTRLELAKSGRAEIKVLEMELGSVDKKTGEVTFLPDMKPDFTTKNLITWEDNGKGGVKVSNTSYCRSVTVLPWWFPLPQGVVSKLVGFVIKQIINTGMKQVNEQIKLKFAA